QRAQLHGAGGDVDLVVDGQDLAFSELGAVAFVIGLRGQGGALVQTLHDFCHVVFRDRENCRNRLQLGNDHEAVGIARSDIVPLIDLAQTDPAGDRGGDVTVDQV